MLTAYGKPKASPDGTAPRRKRLQRVPEALLRHWNGIDAEDVLKALADHAKPDASFRPRKDRRSMRWHACIDGRDFSLILTGPMFLDDDENKGGWGAVKFVQHVQRCDFVAATRFLLEDSRAQCLLPKTT